MTSAVDVAENEIEDRIKGVEKVLSGSGSAVEKLKSVCDYLRGNIPHYDWVGFYVVDPM